MINPSSRRHPLRIYVTATSTEVRSVDAIRLEGELVDIIASYSADGQELLFLVTPPYPHHLDHVPLTVRRAARAAVSHARHAIPAFFQEPDLHEPARPPVRASVTVVRAEPPIPAEADSLPHQR